MKFNDIEAENLKSFNEETTQEFYCSSSSSFGMVVNQKIFDKLTPLNPGTQTTIFFTKNDLGGFSSYFEKNKYYNCGVSIDNKHPENQIWIKVIDILHTDHPEKDIAFEGTIEVEVITPPKDIPLNVKYSSFDEYMADYCGYKSRDKETNKFGYWENPNKKWDWWTLGGRWNDFLLLKSGIKASCAKKSEVDWNKMMDIAGTDAAKKYNKFVTHFGHLPINKTWGECREEFKDDIDAARKYYHAQIRVKEFTEKAQSLSIGDGFYVSADDFLITRDDYINNARKSSIRTFAVLKDGNWSEKGNMGWFGSFSDEKENWSDMYQSILDSIGDNEIISIVDCHI